MQVQVLSHAPMNANEPMNTNMNPPLLVDIGANLAHRRFDSDRDAVLARARAAGVTRQVITGTSVTVSHTTTKLTTHHPNKL